MGSTWVVTVISLCQTSFKGRTGSSLTSSRLLVKTQTISLAILDAKRIKAKRPKDRMAMTPIDSNCDSTPGGADSVCDCPPVFVSEIRARLHGALAPPPASFLGGAARAVKGLGK